MNKNLCETCKHSKDSGKPCHDNVLKTEHCPDYERKTDGLYDKLKQILKQIEKNYDKLLSEAIEYGYLVEVCSGCGRVPDSPGCGCPAGTKYVWKQFVKDLSVDELQPTGGSVKVSFIDDSGYEHVGIYKVGDIVNGEILSINPLTDNRRCENCGIQSPIKSDITCDRAMYKLHKDWDDKKDFCSKWESKQQNIVETDPTIEKEFDDKYAKAFKEGNIENENPTVMDRKCPYPDNICMQCTDKARHNCLNTYDKVHLPVWSRELFGKLITINTEMYYEISCLAGMVFDSNPADFKIRSENLINIKKKIDELKNILDNFKWL